MTVSIIMVFMHSRCKSLLHIWAFLGFRLVLRMLKTSRNSCKFPGSSVSSPSFQDCPIIRTCSSLHFIPKSAKSTSNVLSLVALEHCLSLWLQDYVPRSSCGDLLIPQLRGWDFLKTAFQTLHVTLCKQSPQWSHWWQHKPDMHFVLIHPIYHLGMKLT